MVFSLGASLMASAVFIRLVQNMVIKRLRNLAHAAACLWQQKEFCAATRGAKGAMIR